MNLTENREMMRELTHSQDAVSTLQSAPHETDTLATKLPDDEVDFIWVDYEHDNQMDNDQYEQEFKKQQGTQEILRNNGYSQIADHHMNLAENREMVRDLTVSKETEPIKQVDTQETNIVETNFLDDKADLIWDDYGYDHQMDNFKKEMEINQQQVKVQKAEVEQSGAQQQKATTMQEYIKQQQELRKAQKEQEMKSNPNPKNQQQDLKKEQRKMPLGIVFI